MSFPIQKVGVSVTSYPTAATEEEVKQERKDSFIQVNFQPSSSQYSFKEIVEIPMPMEEKFKILRSRLFDPDPLLRRLAVQTYGVLLPRATESEADQEGEILRGYADDSNFTISANAKWAYAMVSSKFSRKEIPNAVVLFRETLAQTHLLNLQTYLKALIVFRPKMTREEVISFLPQLRNLTNHDDAFTRNAAIETYGAFLEESVTEEGTRARGIFRNLMDHEDEGTRSAAFFAYGKQAKSFTVEVADQEIASLLLMLRKSKEGGSSASFAFDFVVPHLSQKKADAVAVILRGRLETVDENDAHNVAYAYGSLRHRVSREEIARGVNFFCTALKSRPLPLDVKLAFLSSLKIMSDAVNHEEAAVIALIVRRLFDGSKSHDSYNDVGQRAFETYKVLIPQLEDQEIHLGAAALRVHLSDPYPLNHYALETYKALAHRVNQPEAALAGPALRKIFFIEEGYVKIHYDSLEKDSMETYALLGNKLSVDEKRQAIPLLRLHAIHSSYSQVREAAQMALKVIP